MPEADPPDLELSAVDKVFGTVSVVQDATLAFRHGEFLSLLGPSGCGKTTTLSMIAAFETPTRARSARSRFPPTDRPPAPGPAACAVRPEAVRLAGSAGTFPNEVSGTALQATFLGDRWSLIAACSGDTRLLMNLERGGIRPSPGDAILLGWQTDDAALYQGGRRL